VRVIDWLFTDIGGVVLELSPLAARLEDALAGAGVPTGAAARRIGRAVAAAERYARARPHLDLSPNLAAERRFAVGQARAMARALAPPALDPLYLVETCHYAAIARPFADALAALARVRALGLRIGAISNAPPSLRAVLVRTGTAALFDAVVLSSDVGVLKPDDAIYRAALERTGASAERSAFVDDLPANVDAARRNGFALALVVDRDGHAPDRHDRLPDLASLPPLLAAGGEPLAALGRRSDR
jgi:HAD superfamily hydrolase (TIGR01509 family)